MKLLKEVTSLGNRGEGEVRFHFLTHTLLLCLNNLIMHGLLL